MLALLLACASPPPAFTPDLSAFSGPEAACISGSCAAVTSADELDACRKERCPATPESWTVEPTLLRYDGDVVTMSVQVGHVPGTFGDTPVPAAGETWLGATVLKTDGEEIDMAVHTVFPDRLDEPFTFSSQVGPDVEIVIVGLWGKKIEPCDSSRSGCKMFGFVLDHSLAAWPEETYVATAPRRQRFLPERVTVRQVVPADSPAAKAIGDVLVRETERFGTRFDTVGGPAQVVGASAPAGVVVVHRHAHDGPLASEIGAAVSASVGDLPVKACHDPSAESDLLVDLTATPPAGAACR